VPVQPFSEQTVIATIHQFPSLEPLRFETYPANHLNLPTRRDILHRAVVFEGDQTRSGTASTKNRYEVRGSAKKIRPQKGSGRARLGDKKSPMLRGGGVAFGPRPRDFSSELPKKVYDLAWRTALSYRFRKGELIIVDNAMELESPSTRLLNDILKYQEKLRGKGNNLLVTLEERPLLEDALEQLGRGEQTLTWEEVDVKNLLELSRVIIERDALHNILLAHEEDITHTSLQPWHKSFVRKSPPSELESVIGWTEFRDLQLLDAKSLDTARPVAYEEVANKRYQHAASLPEGPERTNLTISAYTLLTQAKKLHFQQTTGMLFGDYTTIVRKQDRDDAVNRFPRIQALEYQRQSKLDTASEAAQVSRTEGESLELEAEELAVEILSIKSEAAVLAAQVHEHSAEAKRLSGRTAAADRVVDLASSEREAVEELEFELLKTRLTHAKLGVKVYAAKNDYASQKKAQAVVDELQEEMQRVRAELEARQIVDEEVDEFSEDVVEDVVREEEKKR
jgi:large subunit ribosomal protein L4